MSYAQAYHTCDMLRAIRRGGANTNIIVVYIVAVIVVIAVIVDDGSVSVIFIDVRARGAQPPIGEIFNPVPL